MSRSFLDAMAARHHDTRQPQSAVKETCLFGESKLSHDLLIVRRVAGAGRGWFVLGGLEAGTELWSEQPLSFAATREGLVRKVEKVLWRHEGLCRKPIAGSRGEAIVAANFFDCGMYGAYLFEKTSLLNHSCYPNASVRVTYGETVASDTRASVTVARRVQADEQLCISYSSTALFLPTRARRELIYDKWGFWCRCDRCEATLPQLDLERWALLEEAAEAADTMGKPASESELTADPEFVALQERAAALVSAWLPSLAEGERFAEAVERYAGCASP